MKACLKIQISGDTRVEGERNKGSQAWSALIRGETKLLENALPAGGISKRQLFVFAWT